MKMSELDMDRQTIERLTDVIPPPSFAQSARAGKIVTKYDPPSIPVRAFDWTAVTGNYEPGDPIGYGYTEAQAVADLRELIGEKAEAF